LKTKGEGSEPKVGEQIWKTIRRLKVTNPMKVFLWKACSNILPTKDNFQRRGIKLDVVCDFCKWEEESVRHVLWDCPAAQDVWGIYGMKLQKAQCEGDGFMDIMEVLTKRCDMDEMTLVASIARNIWLR
jgi:hypothetical protein